MELSDILSNHYYELYSQETKTYTSKKHSGLYSIFNWIVRKIVILELNGFPVEHLEIDYYNQQIYNLFFEKKEGKLDFSDISDEEKIFFPFYWLNDIIKIVCCRPIKWTGTRNLNCLEVL